MGFWSAIWKTPTTNWVYGLLSEAQVAKPYGQQRVVAKDEAYLSATLRRMRIPFSRKGWTAYSGAVHCFGELQYDASKVQLHSLATPVQLKQLAGNQPSKIEMRQQRLFGPVPYRGGDLALELGLFSIETDLAAPYLALLGKVAPLVGIPYVTTALGLVDAFKDGIESLGTQDHTCLEVGVANTFTEVRTGCYVLVGAPSHANALGELTVDGDGTLLRNNIPVEEPHVVFTIDATTTRDDYMALADVGAAYKAVKDELRRNPPDKQRLDASLRLLHVVAALSPDLRRVDADRIYKEVKDLADGLVNATEGVQASMLESMVALEVPAPAGTVVAGRIAQPEWMGASAQLESVSILEAPSAGPPPCRAAEAVTRALSMVNNGGQYQLGTGDYHPSSPDVPWTVNGGPAGSDCAGFAISWCYKLPRHRPGYNVGAWSTCSDDLNCNSALEDAQHAKELFTLVADAPQPGDLLLYPTIYLSGHQFIGHVCIVTGCGRAAGFTIDRPDWSLVDVAQCCGPNGRKPAVLATDGSIWNHHDQNWPKPEHRSWLIRAVRS